MLQILIKGIEDNKLRKKLPVERDLDLNRARDTCRQYKSAVAAVDIIQGRLKVSDVDQGEGGGCDVNHID